MEVIKHIFNQTPTWVFALFFVLLILGIKQSRSRFLSVNKIFIVPVVMVILSLLGVISAFGFSLFELGSWVIGLLLSTLVLSKITRLQGITYQEVDHSLYIPGSWVPLFIMMLIFFTKYFVGFAVGTNQPFIHDHLFITSIIFLYACYSGVFLARSLIIFATYKTLSKS